MWRLSSSVLFHDVIQDSPFLLSFASPFGGVACVFEPGSQETERGSGEQAAYLQRHALEIAYVTYTNISLART